MRAQLLAWYLAASHDETALSYYHTDTQTDCIIVIICAGSSINATDVMNMYQALPLVAARCIIFEKMFFCLILNMKTVPVVS